MNWSQNNSLVDKCRMTVEPEKNNLKNMFVNYEVFANVD